MAEPLLFVDANPVQRLVRRFASSDPGSWVFAHVAHHMDRPVFRWTRGRHTVGSLLTGLPVVMLTTTGARTGRPRTVPILGFPTQDGGVAVIASNFGQRPQTGWYHNLRARPEGEVAVDGHRWRCRAEEVTGDQRDRIWSEALKVYPGFAQYERRAAHRRIHVFFLHPA